MAISDTITSMEGHISDDYQAISNMGIDLTGINKNIENIAQCVNQIYDNAPKTSFGEGTEITLENGLKGKIDFDTEDNKKIVGYGDTEQESTTGKQLFQMPSTQTLTDVTLTQNADESLDIVGTAGANRDFATDFISLADTGLTLGGSYYLSLGETFSGVSIQIVGYNSSNGWVATSSMQSTTQGQAITLFSDSSITKIKFILRVYSGTTINQKNIKIMLNTGNSRADFEKYTGGIPAPNPSFPFQVKSVAGKNLLDTSAGNINIGGATSTITYDDEGYMTITNNNSSASYINIPLATDRVQIGQPYTLKVEWGTSELTYIYLQKSNDDYSKYVYTTTTTTTTNTPISNFMKVLVLVNANKTIKVRLQVEEGTSASSYLPYNTLEEVISGKNLIPFPYSSQAGLISGVNWSVNADGTINANGTADVTSSIFYLANGDSDIYLDAGTYKISSNLFDDPHGFSVQAIQIVNGSYGTVYFSNMVLTERTRLRVRVLAKPNVAVDVQNAYMMIEAGSSATTYEPYQTPQTYQLSLGSLEFNSIDNYTDELLTDRETKKWYKLEKIGKVVLDGSETWEGGEVQTGIYRYQITLTDAINVASRENVLTEYSHFSLTGEVGTGFIFSKIFYFYPDRDKTNVLLFKAWLTEHNTPLLYPLATPTLIEITDINLINQLENWYNGQSFNGTTIITSNGNLPMPIKVRALKGE